MMHREEGPFDIFARIRDEAGIKYDQYSERYATNEIGKMLLCFWCTSIWAAIVIAVVTKRIGIADILASSAGAIVVNEIVLDRGHNG